MSELTTTITPAPPAKSRRVLRSVGAVFAGLLTNIVVVGAIDAAMRVAGIFPPIFQPMDDQQWAIALVTRVIFAVVGGFVTAKLAPSRPMRHAIVLGAIETAMSLLFVVANWNKAEFGPHWFAVGVAATCLPLAALGGLLAAKRTAHANK